ncbi:helix-turn-helix domain-containing protein [Paenibacillus lautus]|uniref:helix-turn-helix domain-containing protein n=1 Tax=Paenibacillus lautus TaxID=1401 RepID=UPI00384E8C5F
MSVLGDRLKEEREKRGWSQVLVSRKLGLKRSSTYANWEYGIREPDLEMIQKLADLYEVSIDQLNGRDEKESDLSLPEDVILNVIKEAEAEYKVNLRDDPVVESAVRDLIHNLAKMKKATQKNK